MVDASEGTVAEQFTGPQLLELAGNLLDDGDSREALEVLQLGVRADAYHLAAMPVLARIAASGSRYNTSEAVGMMRYVHGTPC